mgnify:CR=1 FL=1
MSILLSNKTSLQAHNLIAVHHWWVARAKTILGGQRRKLKSFLLDKTLRVSDLPRLVLDGLDPDYCSTLEGAFSA